MSVSEQCKAPIDRRLGYCLAIDIAVTSIRKLHSVP